MTCRFKFEGYTFHGQVPLSRYGVQTLSISRSLLSRVPCIACNGRHSCQMRFLAAVLTGPFGFGIKKNLSLLCHSSPPLYVTPCNHNAASNFFIEFFLYICIIYHVFFLFQKSVNDICWSPSSATLFACVNDKAVEIWDLSINT